MQIEWSEEALNTLRLLMTEVPLSDREEAEASTKEQAERLVPDEHRETLRPDDVIAAYIVQTPQHLRDGLRVVLSNLGYDPDNYRKYFEMHRGREGFRDPQGKGTHKYGEGSAPTDWTPRQGPEK